MFARKINHILEDISFTAMAVSHVLALEATIMHTIFQWITLSTLLFCLITMLYNGIRQQIFVVNRWSPQPVEPDGHVPPNDGLIFNPLQYSFDMRNLDHIDVITFCMKYSSVGRSIHKRASLLSEPMSDQKATNTAICLPVLASFDYAIDQLRKCLSKRGKAFHDANHPVILKFEYQSENDRVYTTSFLIYHANLYCYCFRALDKWRYFIDSPYELTDENGELAEKLHLDSSYTGCYEAVGGSTLVKALKDLNTDFGEKSFAMWKNACLHLVFCFLESTRFRDIEYFVREALRNSIVEDPYIKLCKALVNSWGTLSDAIHDYELSGNFTLSSDVREKYHITGDTAERQADCARYMVPVRLR